MSSQREDWSTGLSPTWQFVRTHIQFWLNSVRQEKKLALHENSEKEHQWYRTAEKKRTGRKKNLKILIPNFSVHSVQSISLREREKIQFGLGCLYAYSYYERIFWKMTHSSNFFTLFGQGEEMKHQFMMKSIDTSQML